MKRFVWIVLILLWASACTPTSETAVATPPPPATAVPPTHTVPPPVITETREEVAEATAVSVSTQPASEPTATQTQAIEEVGVISGRTAEGAFFLGDPTAPITHIDYSDFL
ncbi:MAG: hypothetical protein KC445_07480 [Anaerolineales bacterium]|nr:hypothetical protein [Anaerolineales bacterium]